VKPPVLEEEEELARLLDAELLAEGKPEEEAVWPCSFTDFERSLPCFWRNLGSLDAVPWCVDATDDAPGVAAENEEGFDAFVVELEEGIVDDGNDDDGG